MQSFIFSYGAKQLAESMLGIQAALTWNGKESLFGRRPHHPPLPDFPHPFRALSIAGEVFLGIRRPWRACWACIMNSPHGFSRYESWSRTMPTNSRRSATRCRRRSSRAEHPCPPPDMACAARFRLRAVQAGPSDAPGGRRTGLNDRAAGLHFLDMAEHEYQTAVQALFRIPTRP